MLRFNWTKFTYRINSLAIEIFALTWALRSWLSHKYEIEYHNWFFNSRIEHQDMHYESFHNLSGWSSGAEWAKNYKQAKIFYKVAVNYFLERCCWTIFWIRFEKNHQFWSLCFRKWWQCPCSSDRLFRDLVGSSNSISVFSVRQSWHFLVSFE